MTFEEQASDLYEADALVEASAFSIELRAAGWFDLRRARIALDIISIAKGMLIRGDAPSAVLAYMRRASEPLRLASHSKTVH